MWWHPLKMPLYRCEGREPPCAPQTVRSPWDAVPRHAVGGLQHTHPSFVFPFMAALALRTYPTTSSADVTTSPPTRHGGSVAYIQHGLGMPHVLLLGYYLLAAPLGGGAAIEQEL